MDQQEDYLLNVTGSGSSYQLHATPMLQDQGKAASYSNLVQELFNVDPEPVPMDIGKEFANDSETTLRVDEKKKPPMAMPKQEHTSTSAIRLIVDETGSFDDVQQQHQHQHQHQQHQHQQGSGPKASMPFTLEYKRMQVTHRPQVLCQPPREPPTTAGGTTRQSTVPTLPEEALLGARSQQPGPPTVPALPVFGSSSGTGMALVRQPQPQPKLELIDLEMLEEVLSPVSLPSSRTTEVASTPLVELSPPTQEQAPRRHQSSESSPDDQDLDRKAAFIRKAIDQYHRKGAVVSSNGKVQAHEVVLVMLLAQGHTADEASLGGVLAFCTEEGFETGQQEGSNFLAKDTKTMGRIWQKLKGNKNANYDTFARAMRVGRERQKDYFGYLDAGKGTKKRVYKLGPKCVKELERMKTALA